MWEDKGAVPPLRFWVTGSHSFCPSTIHLLFSLCIYCHVCHTVCVISCQSVSTTQRSAAFSFVCPAQRIHLQCSSIPGSGRSPREGVGYPLQYSWAPLVAQTVRNPPTWLSDWTTPTKVCGGFPSNLCPCNKLDKCCSTLRFLQTMWWSHINANFIPCNWSGF